MASLRGVEGSSGPRHVNSRVSFNDLLHVVTSSLVHGASTESEKGMARTSIGSVTVILSNSDLPTNSR